MKKRGLFIICLVLLSSLTLAAPLLAATPQSAAKSNLSVTQVDINSASSQELQSIPGIGATLAERIITYRQEHGAFKSTQELSAIRGIGEKSLAKLLPWVSVR